MAAKPRGPGKPFPKGQSGNPAGSSARKRQLRQIAALTNEQVSDIGALILNGDRKALAEIGQDPDATVLQVWMAGLVVNSMKKGCPQTFRVLMDRLVGRSKETVEYSGPGGGPIQSERVVMTTEQKLERLELLRRQRELAGK